MDLKDFTMPWGALATVGSALLGQKSAKRRASEQMDYQTDMSNTAYQRVMEDMRKAGLNPILAGKLGGASTPSGAMAATPDFGSVMNKAISTRNLKKLQEAQVQSAQSTAKNLFEQARINKQNADYFDKKPYGSAVLNARPLNIFFTHLLENNPEILEMASDLVTSGLQNAKDPIGFIKSMFSGELPLGSSAKNVARNKNKLNEPKIYKRKVHHFKIKRPKKPYNVKDITPASLKFQKYYENLGIFD